MPTASHHILSASNKNLVGITQDLRQITGKLTVAGRSGNCLAPSGWPLTCASACATWPGPGPRRLLADRQRLCGPDAPRHAPAGPQHRHPLAGTLGSLQQQVQTGAGPLHTLLTNTAMSGQLRQPLGHVEQGTAGFNQNMEALKHNFPLRGCFRKQAKKQAQAAGQPVAF